MFVTLVVLISCVVIGLIGVPLGLRLIPRNPIYGLRTDRTMSDEEAWFEVNRAGGWALVAAAGLTAILVMAYNGTWLRPWWAQFGVLLVMVGIAVGVTIAFERKLPRRQRKTEE